MFTSQNQFMVLPSVQGPAQGVTACLTRSDTGVVVPTQVQDKLRNIFLGFVGFFLIVGVVNLMAGLDYAGKKLLW